MRVRNIILLSKLITNQHIVSYMDFVINPYGYDDSIVKANPFKIEIKLQSQTSTKIMDIYHKIS